jgi:hypothetical protein
MYLDEYMSKIRHEEFLAEAENNRLLSLSRRKPGAIVSATVRFLVWFGSLLRRLGSLLEDRFATEVSTKHARSADRGLNV